MTPAVHLLVMLILPSVPLAIAAALLLKPRSTVLHAAAVLAPLPGLVTSLSVPAGIGVTLPWLLEGSELGLDTLGRLFLFFSAAIWLAAALHAYSTIGAAARGRFFVYFLAAMAGNLGLVVAQDVLAFYLLFSLMSFAAYGLVVHDGTRAARRAGAFYITLVVAGDMMLYAALVPAAFDAGGNLLLVEVRDAIAASPRRDMILALLLAGFGVKAGVIGLHFVLPLIYRASPVPGGAALAGAMLHAGLLGWLRLLPLDAAAGAWGNALIALGLAGALYGVLVGCAQRDPRALLGYSSISQIGIMLAALGAGLAASAPADGILAAVAIYALHHALAKTALFFGVALAAAPPSGALGRAAVRFGLVWPSAALVGVPLTSGMLAKEVLKEEVYASGAEWADLLAQLLPWTAFGTGLLVARLLWLTWPLREDAGTADGRIRRPGPVLAWAATLALSMFGVWAQPLEQVPQLWGTAVLLELLWPAAAAAAVAAIAAALAQRSVLGRRASAFAMLPPGDVAVPAARLVARGRTAWRRFRLGPLPQVRNAVRDRSTEALRDPRWAAAAARLEDRLGRWSVAITLFVLAALAFALAAVG